jgi:hypothetical protein
MYETIETVVVSLVLVLFGVAVLSRRFRNVAWLQRFPFDHPRLRLSEEERARMQRRLAVRDGVKFILLGLALPPGYLMLEMMLLSDISKTKLAVVLAGSVLCIGVGIRTIVGRPR